MRARVLNQLPGGAQTGDFRVVEVAVGVDPHCVFSPFREKGRGVGVSPLFLHDFLSVRSLSAAVPFMPQKVTFYNRILFLICKALSGGLLSALFHDAREYALRRVDGRSGLDGMRCIQVFK